jgi:hypothetical protein
MATTMAAILALGGAARAGKPTQSEANKAAKAWLAALKIGDHAPDAAALKPMTAVPFALGAYFDEEPRCKSAVITGGGQLGDAFDCLGGAIEESDAKAKAKTYKKGDLALYAAKRAKDVLAVKDARLVRLQTPCSGSETITVVAVVKDDAGAIKVAGVYYDSMTCGE